MDHLYAPKEAGHVGGELMLSFVRGRTGEVTDLPKVRMENSGL